MTRQFEIPMERVREAYRRVKENAGASGIDGVTLEKFEKNLEDNTYVLWNRITSGSYFPKAVRGVEIPKRSGGKRLLGIPSVEDRIAQMIATMYLEPLLEPIFHNDSYGYRPGKSALDAVAAAREGCWQYDWVLKFDVKGLFDNIDHDRLMKLVRKHTESRWVTLYTERWLKVPVVMPDGALVERTKGTPQGGVISPLLANLFLHYAFDSWMKEYQRDKKFERFADDGLVHCRTFDEAVAFKESLEKRLNEWGLELNQEKTRIYYCKDDDRNAVYPDTSFDFLGYTFRPRRSKNRYGKFFINFTPAVSNEAKKNMRRTIHDWRMHLKPDKTIEDLSNMFNPVVRGWLNYYGRFYRSELYGVFRYLNNALILWIRRKYKRYNNHGKRAENFLAGIARRDPHLFSHWQIGVFPTVG